VIIGLGDCPSEQLRYLRATKAGFYDTTYHGKVPKIQILTIAELFAGKKPQIPFIDPTTFRRARTEETARQERLF
jgi:site-specific DNA-methyltransferase (adenine-specific)